MLLNKDIKREEGGGGGGGGYRYGSPLTELSDSLNLNQTALKTLKEDSQPLSVHSNYSFKRGKKKN